MSKFTNQDVAVVVCTKNSISRIGQCLDSLRQSDVGELIVVDASSTDGTREISLEEDTFHGVSAQTSVRGSGFSLEGKRLIIGTPTLFIGDTLRHNPYDPTTKFSDDSELCERWAKQFDAGFAISRSTHAMHRPVAHPARVDLIEPVLRLPMQRLPTALPFLAIFTMYRYLGWIKSIRN
jgi:hypothetical protein